MGAVVPPKHRRTLGELTGICQTPRAHHLVGLEDDVLRHVDQFRSTFEIRCKAIAAGGARNLGL
jgi:hypothetical protein